MKRLGATARILIVDDDASIRATFSAILEEEGYVVDTAENGEEAIKKSNSQFFNLALIDIRLPDMEGTRLLTALKQGVPSMIKIIVTGYPSLGNCAEALNQGADGYLFKPVDLKTLLKTIKAHLEKQREASKYSEQKVAEFIETRAREFALPLGKPQ